MAKTNQKKTKTARLEENYAEFMRMLQVPFPAPTYRENLKQPSPLKIVESVTTYGAYEKPI